MVECADFKIDKHATSDSPDIIPYKISEKWERSESRDPQIHTFDTCILRAPSYFSVCLFVCVSVHTSFLGLKISKTV